MFDVLTQKAFAYTSIINETYKDDPEKLELLNYVQPPNELSLCYILKLLDGVTTIYPTVRNDRCTGEYTCSNWKYTNILQRLQELQRAHRKHSLAAGSAPLPPD